jgi:hypothetical protein
MAGPTWSWISRRVENQAFQLIQEHMNIMLDLATAFNKLFQAFKEGDSSSVKNYYEEVFRLERTADEIKRKAIKELSSGYIHPIDREEIIRLILTIDEIAAYMKGASRRATMEDPNLVDINIRSLISIMAEKANEAVKKLKEGVVKVTTQPKEALELADQVETIEEEVDEIRAEALYKTLKYCDKSKPSTCLLTKEIVDSIENSVDRCEDSADVIRSIAVMHL